jgi:hypothetical protein
MTRTQIQFPDPLYRRLKEVAAQQDWSLAEVMRKAAEHFVARFPQTPPQAGGWSFPTLDCGGEFLEDPTGRAEAEAILQRTGS